MTNPQRTVDSRGSGYESHETPVDIPPETGRQAARQKNLSETAGGASSDAPRQFSHDEVFELLLDAIADLDRSGKTPFAAGVSAKMRNLRKDFSLPRSPYRTFRELVTDAEGRGLVITTLGADDLTLKVAPPQASDARTGQTLREDLWGAILDWSNTASYVFNPTTRGTTRSGGASSAGIPVPSVDKDARLQWMTAFAESEKGQSADALHAALRDENPAARFHTVVRSTDALKRRWNRALRDNVLRVAVEWAHRHNIPEKDIFVDRADQKARRDVSAAGDTAQAQFTDEHLRQRLLEVLAQMPLHELLRLSIPLEYSVTR